MSTNFLFDADGKIHSYYLPTGGGGGSGSSDITISAGDGIVVDFSEDVYTVSNPYTFTGTTNVTVTQNGDQWIFSAIGGSGDVEVVAGTGIGVAEVAPNVFSIANEYLIVGTGDVTVTQTENLWIIAGTAPDTAFTITAGDGIDLSVTGDNAYTIGVSYTFTGAGDLVVTQNVNVFTLSVPPAPTADLVITNADDTIVVVQTGALYEISCPITVTSANALLTITQDGQEYILHVTDSTNTFTFTSATENLYVVKFTGTNFYIYGATVTGNNDNVNVQFTGSETDSQYIVSAYGVTGGPGVEVVVTDNQYVVNITGAGFVGSVTGIDGITVNPTDGTFVVAQQNAPFYMIGSYTVSTGAVAIQEFGKGDSDTYQTSGYTITVSALNLNNEAVGRYMGSIALNTDPVALNLSLECVNSTNPSNITEYSLYSFDSLTVTATNDFIYFNNVSYLSGAYDPLVNDSVTLSLLSAF